MNKNRNKKARIKEKFYHYYCAVKNPGLDDCTVIIISRTNLKDRLGGKATTFEVKEVWEAYA